MKINWQDQLAMKVVMERVVIERVAVWVIPSFSPSIAHSIVAMVFDTCPVA